MAEVKVRELMAQIKAEAIQAVVPADAVQVDSGTFLYHTDTGLAKLTIGAVKDQETDVGALEAAYLAKLAEREAKAEAKAAEKAAKA